MHVRNTRRARCGVKKRSDERAEEIKDRVPESKCVLHTLCWQRLRRRKRAARLKPYAFFVRQAMFQPKFEPGGGEQESL